jgi:hypothetical protein
MKRALAVSLILVLLASALFWMCPLVLASPTLTVASKLGGSVIVSFGANSITLGPGEKQSWLVRNGTKVTLMATDIASGFEFSGWDGPLYWPDNFANPVSIAICSSTNITAYFNLIGAPNGLSVNLFAPKNITYHEKDVSVRFEVTSSRECNIEVYDIRFYLDGRRYWGFETSSLRSGSGEAYWFNSTVSVLEEGEHSFYVAAAATFHVSSNIIVGPGSPSPGSGFSDIVHFVVDTTSPRVPSEPSSSESFPITQIASAAIIASVAVVSFGLVAYLLRRKSKRRNQT